MGLIVPILRILYVALNVYDTFKTLKPPPGSARTGGRPTVRAMSQRKRAMKGCLAIWLIWCCYAVYERTVDGIIGMFIPFYSEIKAILILFFLLTRARGAEPVYLHILRPMVKPYTATLDLVVEAVTQLGDLVFLFCAVPFHMMSSLFDVVWNRWILRKPNTSEDTKETPSAAEEKQQAPSEHGETRTRKRVLHNAHVKAAAEPSSPDASIYATPKAAPEIWHPPSSSYKDSPPDASVGLPTPPAEDQIDKRSHTDEWRQYEAFPSAWPASPLSGISGLPPQSLESLPSLGDVFADTAKESQQGFRRSLQLSRESPNPDSDGDLSDDNEERIGVHTGDEMEMDEEYDDEEDDFNITLRTPHPPSRVMKASGLAASEEDSLDDSTGISTTDYGSPLRTRTNSENSDPYLEDSPSAGRKRRLPSPTRPTQVARPAMGERTGTQDTIRAKTMTARPSVRAPLVARKQSSKGGESSASEAIIQEDDKSAVKKRLVETKPRSRPGTVRPITTKVGENKVPPRKLPATASIPRGPVRAATTNKPALKLATASSRDSTNQPLGEKVVEKVVEEVPADIIDPIFA